MAFGAVVGTMNGFEDKRGRVCREKIYSIFYKGARHQGNRCAACCILSKVRNGQKSPPLMLDRNIKEAEDWQQQRQNIE